jgi:predicted small metal-binding protein
MGEHHDHNQPTHSAGCDACSYIAEAHAHSDDEAVNALVQDLAAHNKAVHNQETNPEAIKDPVRAKMKFL